MTALGGWIASGGENTAYFGGQLRHAFHLCIDQGFSPTVDYEEIRNRFMGIMLGLCVSGWVYANLWPQRAVDRVRPSLARVFRDLARLILIPRDGPPAAEQRQETRQLRRALLAALASTLRLAELSEDESDDAKPAARALRLSMLTDLVAQEAQAMFLVANILTTHKALSAQESLPAAVRAAELELRRNIADELRATADLIETGRNASMRLLAAALQEWRTRAAGETPGPHALLLERLTARGQQLQESRSA